MPAATQVSVSEYLSTTYRPDREYVDGEIVERNVGKKPHSRAQTLMAAFLSAREAEWGIESLVEQTVQVSPTAETVQLPPGAVESGMTVLGGTPAGKLVLPLTESIVTCRAAEFGETYYTRIDAPATPEQKAKLRELSPEAVKASSLVGEPITAKLTRAPGNNAVIGDIQSIAPRKFGPER